MGQLLDIFKAYPVGASALIVGPILVALYTAIVGYDSLSARLLTDRQQDRIESNQKQFGDDLKGLSLPIETIRRYEGELLASGQKFDLLSKIVQQYDRLTAATSEFEKFTGVANTNDRLSAADYTLEELKSQLSTITTVKLGPGLDALIVGVSPNTFQITFGVPMRIAPTITFSGLPPGAVGNALDVSNIGFTVVFTPSSIPVTSFGFLASAEL